MHDEQWDTREGPATLDECGKFAAKQADAEVDTDATAESKTDATTGASPGTAQACDDLGLNSLEVNLCKFNIKPPGVA